MAPPIPAGLIPLLDAVEHVRQARHGDLPAPERQPAPQYQFAPGSDMAAISAGFDRLADSLAAIGRGEPTPEKRARDELWRALANGPALRAQLIADADGKRHPIPPAHWTSSDAGSAFFTGKSMVRVVLPPPPAGTSPSFLLTFAAIAGAISGRVVLRVKALDRWLRQPAGASTLAQGADPTSWMRAYVEEQRKQGSHPKREPSIVDCYKTCRCTYRQAQAAWDALPPSLRRKKTDTDRALIGP